MTTPKYALSVYDKETIDYAVDTCNKWFSFKRQPYQKKKQIINKVKTINYLIRFIDLEHGELLSERQKSIVATNWKGGYYQFRSDVLTDSQLSSKLKTIQTTLRKFI